MSLELRDITDVDGCRAVVEVQEQVWGAGSEIVPASVLLVSAKRGGILIGAFVGDELVGFVWSMPGWRSGQPTHWSHMLGIVPAARGRGLGEALKLAQRARAISFGVELIEWTFDPLQSANAHLNLSRLGAVAGTYLVNVYGDMPGPLHHGTPTDRLIAEWWLRRPHVERRAGAAPALVARDARVLEAPQAIEAVRRAEWVETAGVRTDLSESRVLVAVPPRFGEMQQQATDLALAWRHASREVFLNYFSRGYQAVDFYLDRDTGGGHYLLSIVNG